MAKKMYAIIDDQSNKSLVKTEFFELMNVKGPEVPYTLSTCTGCIETSGRRANGLIVEALDHTAKIEVPTLIKCNERPSVRDEIPTPEVAQHYSHLKNIGKGISPLDTDAQILMLIGRDAPDAHHVHDQRIGPRNAPYAHRLSLGWVIVGEACLGKVHKPDFVNANKVNVLNNGRPSIFSSCQNEFGIKGDHSKNERVVFVPFGHNILGDAVFERNNNDEKLGLSYEDREFLHIMDREFHRGPEGNWVAPLPFRSQRSQLPNNRTQALKRAKTLDRDLQRNPLKRQHFTAFMQKVLDCGHAELTPPLKEGEECWYLPIFGVYHPQKPDQIRAVFDSSAKHKGVSLNDVLLTGPDMTNNLLGILLRFRKDQVAITTDIQQMFHCFLVREDHRNFLRFLWYSKITTPTNSWLNTGCAFTFLVTAPHLLWPPMA